MRRIVFIEEQGVSLADEIDGMDDEAVHVLLTQNGAPVGTARMLSNGDTGKIGRVAVLKPHRGKGYGKRLVMALIEHAKAQGLARVKLGSQMDAAGFYEGLGFTATGDPFLDAGQPHQMMVRDL